MVTIFHDVDGVHADFDGRAREIFGMSFDEATKRVGMKEAWRQVRHYRQPGTGFGFYRSLDQLPGAAELWDATKNYQRSFLTGCPFGTWAPPEKVEWAAAKYTPEARIITCMARDKIKYIENPGDILIDDKTKFQSVWEEGGGVFVHHTDVPSTLVKLREMGLI